MPHVAGTAFGDVTPQRREFGLARCGLAEHEEQRCEPPRTAIKVVEVRFADGNAVHS